MLICANLGSRTNNYINHEHPVLSMEATWEVWNEEKEYGNVFYDRAVGKLPEMESSKAAAKVVSTFARENDLILDVGCGAGHYLVSLDKQLSIPFRYWGIDATQSYVEHAKKAFAEQVNENRTFTNFSVGDIFNLKVEDNRADIVMSNNVLLHLPSITQPIQELVRIAKKYVIIRMLIGKSSLRIKHVMEPEIFDESGEPQHFYYLNIYSEKYVRSLLDNIPGIESYEITADIDFDPGRLGAGDYHSTDREKPFDCTTVVEGMQINNHVIQPWSFVIIKIKES